MALEGFTGTTYEVLSATDGRWLIDSVHRVRAKAMDRAEAMLSGGRDLKVRVTAKRDDSGAENVIFEQASSGAPKMLSAKSVDEAPYCQKLAEFFEFGARRTMGRVLRAFLDHHGITAVELLHSKGHMNALEREDRLFNQAVQIVAALQVKGTKKRQIDRVDELYQTLGKLRKRAERDGEAAEDLYQNSLPQGFAALWDTVGGKGAKAERMVQMALAFRLGEAGDGANKIGLMLDLVDNAANPPRLDILDGVMAEILDNPATVKELIGDWGDSGSALKATVRLAYGRFPVNKRSHPVLERLNARLGATPLPLCRQVLLERVELTLRGISPLTREGREEERLAFMAIFRELFEAAGLGGGSQMAEATVLRAKSVLGDGHEDLSSAVTLQQLIQVIPSQAVRLGFLMDLTRTDFFTKNDKLILGLLLRLTEELKSAADIVPPGVSPERRAAVVAGLKARVARLDLSDEMGAAFTKALEKLLTAKPKAKTKTKPAPKKTPPPTTEPPKTAGDDDMAKGKLVRRKFEKGTIIFEEGEIGQEAYVVVSGKVQIFRRIGDNAEVLADLGTMEMFGEMSLVDHQPRMASARALEDCDLTVISRDDLDRRLDRLAKEDRAVRWLIDVLVKRLRGQARGHE